MGRRSSGFWSRSSKNFICLKGGEGGWAGVGLGVAVSSSILAVVRVGT